MMCTIPRRYEELRNMIDGVSYGRLKRFRSGSKDLEDHFVGYDEAR